MVFIITGNGLFGSGRYKKVPLAASIAPVNVVGTRFEMLVSAGAPKLSKDMNTISPVVALLENTNSSLIGPDGPPSRIRAGPGPTICGNKNWMPGPAYAVFRVHEPVTVSARTTHCPFSLNEIEKGSGPVELPA
jgi:hypothetical protein